MSVKIRIIYRDRYLLIVHKPSGLSVHKDAQSPTLSVGELLLNSLKIESIYPVHRLDEGTCGILIFAFDPKTADLMQKLFLEGKMKKKYWAIVFGDLPLKGKLDSPLKSNKTKKMQRALTHYKKLGVCQNESFALSWLECEPQTGRFHQIRRHLRGMDTPIVGDEKYSSSSQMAWAKKELKLNRIGLSAVEVAFTHPVLRRKMVLQTNPDPSLEKVIKTCFKRLKFDGFS